MARRKRTSTATTRPAETDEAPVDETAGTTEVGTEETDAAVADDAVTAEAETDRAESDDFDGFGDTIAPRRRAAKRPAEPARRRAEASKRRSPARLEVPDEAKDSSATGTARARRSAEAERTRTTTTRRRVAATAPNPAWLAPTAVTLLIVGLVYLVTFYLSGGQLPLPIQDWNLLVGFGIMVVGGGLLMRWK